MPEPEKTPEQGKTEPSKAPVDDINAMKQELEKLRAEKQEWMSKDQTLNDKVKLQNQEKEKKDSDSKALESALTFNLTSKDFIKMNESVLPKEISDIFQIAEKEKYEGPIQKANATKAAIIQSFFSQQSNVDLLTGAQQSTLADYLKLTKNGKEDKAQQIYENLLEPALGTLKRVKKAEELAKASQGFGGNTDSEQAYKEKLIKMSEKKFFRGKHA